LYSGVRTRRAHAAAATEAPRPAACERWGSPLMHAGAAAAGGGGAGGPVRAAGGRGGAGELRLRAGADVRLPAQRTHAAARGAPQPKLLQLRPPPAPHARNVFRRFNFNPIKSGKIGFVSRGLSPEGAAEASAPGAAARPAWRGQRWHAEAGRHSTAGLVVNKVCSNV